MTLGPLAVGRAARVQFWICGAQLMRRPSLLLAVLWDIARARLCR
ncbi:hypothetical protein [Pseudorhodobacter sp.]|nr:hypothetical protein [Pseudorhodobacter sp.]